MNRSSWRLLKSFSGLDLFLADWIWRDYIKIPSPHKLLLAEKRILITELDHLKRSDHHLQPRQLFTPPSTNINQSNQPAYNVVSLNVSPQQNNSSWPQTPTSTTTFPANSTTSKDESPAYMDNRQQELSENLQLMRSEIESAKLEINKREKEMKNGQGANSKGKLCSGCHRSGHTKAYRAPTENVLVLNIARSHPNTRKWIKI